MKDEKGKLLNILNSMIDKSKLKRIDELQNEIKNHYNVIDNCKMTTVKLSEEIAELKNKLGKCLNKINKNSDKSKNEKSGVCQNYSNGKPVGLASKRMKV